MVPSESVDWSVKVAVRLLTVALNAAVGALLPGGLVLPPQLPAAQPASQVYQSLS